MRTLRASETYGRGACSHPVVRERVTLRAGSAACVASIKRNLRHLQDAFAVRRMTCCPHQKTRGKRPRVFVVRNSPQCGGAARLTAEPVTASQLTLAERCRAAFPSEFLLTLRRTAPFVRILLISPVCAFAFPFAVPSSLRASFREDFDV